jgi:CRP-like cAMP-binding protein
MAFWKRPDEGADWLSGVSFFEGFTPAELKRVAALSSEVEAPAGTVVIDQGDAGVECFVIVEGTVAVYIGKDPVATNGPGDVIGEMALVDHQPRSASVIAETDVRLLRFDSRHFRQLLAEMPKAEDRIMAMLTARLRARG